MREVLDKIKVDPGRELVVPVSGRVQCQQLPPQPRVQISVNVLRGPIHRRQQPCRSAGMPLQ